MKKAIKEQILFVLEDDNEVMRAALDSDLDEENKEMNRELIKEHERIIKKVEAGEGLEPRELQLVRDANQVHLNDRENVAGRHTQAVMLDEWLKTHGAMTVEEAMEILEQHLDQDSHTPALIYSALHWLWEAATPAEAGQEAAFDDEGRCLKCGSKVSFADVTDTLVCVGREFVKRYDGDITNRNCVRCTYPEQYPEYEEYDKAASEG